MRNFRHRFSRDTLRRIRREVMRDFHTMWRDRRWRLKGRSAVMTWAWKPYK